MAPIDVIGFPMMIVFFVGLFVSVRFCVRMARQFASTQKGARDDHAPRRQMERVHVRVLERESEPEPEQSLIEVIPPNEALPPSPKSSVRQTLR
jgi:hypothetical protein